MTSREKRLEKGIESLKKQIEIHEEKKKIAKELGQEELTKYFDKEIESFRKRVENRKIKLERK